MNKAKSEGQFIIMGAISFLLFFTLGCVFNNYVNYSYKNIVEYSNINRSQMHPLDSLIYKMV